jgi:branched-chain amino acid transport system substrate-binding protein
MKMKNLSFILLISIIYLMGCSEDCNCPNDNEKQTIKIGVLMPSTGNGASTGQSALTALEIAKQDINAYLTNISSKYEIDFITKDSETEPDVALAKVKEFHNEGIKIIIGPYSSSSIVACKSYVDENDMLMVSPSSVSHSLAIPNDNIYRMAPSDSSQAIAMAQIFKYGFDRRVIFPLVRDDEWGNDLYELAKDAYEAIGGEMAEPVKYSTDAKDFSNVLNTLDDKIIQFYEVPGDKEAGVYLISFGEGVNILQNADNYSLLSGTNITWYGSSAFSNNSELVSNPEAASYVLSRFFPCPIFGLMKDAEYKWAGLQAELTQKLGRTPEVYALLAYDALWLSTLAYLHTGHDSDFSYLKNAFVAEADNYFGVSGPTSFDQNGDRKFVLYDIWRVQKPVGNYEWIKVGQYDGTTNALTWFN